MTVEVRPAAAGDVEALARMGAVQRRRLEGWSPQWWRRAAGADDLHPLWLGHLVEADGPVVTVATDGGAVVGGTVALPAGERWIVDDLVVLSDERWADAGRALLDAVAGRPALTCVATGDRARAAAAGAAGLARVASYWIGPTNVGGDDEGGGPGPESLDDLDLPPAPPHTFGALDPAAPGALALRIGDGAVVGSPSVPAPPVYDPGGTVGVVDRVVGPDRPGLLRAARATAARRGDVLLAVVAGADDADLARAAEGARLERTVDVWAWPPDPAGHHPF